MADGIKIGNLDISAFKVGSGDCKVYLGDALLYPNVETSVIAKFNVTSTTSPTPIGYNQYISGFSSIEIDDVVQPSVVSAYTFDTTGEHTVKYTLTDKTVIGERCLRGCSNITNVVIPKNVRTIGYGAFYKCSGMISVDISNGVTTIDDYAFTGCTSLTSIDIPDSVTSIGSSSFYNCSGLTDVTIGSGVTEIGTNAFNGCKNFTSIEIPNGVTDIESQSFYGCGSLTSVTIPSSVTTISVNAFKNCSGLTNITIPSSVTEIANSAFANCTSLTSITVEATTPPILGEDAFNNNASGRKIYVPSASVNDYKAASGWSTYASDIEPIP